MSTVTYLPTAEKWLTLKDAADYYGCSVRWLKYRISEGMPSEMIAGRRKIRLSETDSWLEAHGRKRG